MKISTNYLNNFFKGLLIGLGAIIPGLSGGTMAVITNSFEEILKSITNIFIDFKKSFFFLFSIGIGAIISIFSFSFFLDFFNLEYPIFSKYTYIFITLISTVIFSKNSIKAAINKNTVLSLLIGFCLSFSISFLTENISISDNLSNPLCMILIGLPLAIALVLPGISFSYMLYFFGIYNQTIKAVRNFDLDFLLLLFCGIGIGTFIFSKCLLKLLDAHKQETYTFVLGFMLNSMIDIILI
ncbi:MAG: DUF368 domain-containing protein [Clostridia bacterium]|nr:DUF368 domain-containing protein [Clostridia bacterium]